MSEDVGKYMDVMLNISELRHRFNQKLDDQLFIIEQQRDRIDYQQQQINDQRVYIEELAWQIRDQRDVVRECNELLRKPSHNENAENESHINISASHNPNQTRSNHVRGSSINLDAQSMPIHLETTKRIQRQHAIDANEATRDDECDIQTFLNNCIPPPPLTSPPRYDSDSDLEPVQISSQTFEKLNQLYEMRRFVRRNSIEEDENDEIEFRLREFNVSERTKRGSSKTLCSFVSDYEVDYLPRLDEEGSEVDSVTFQELKPQPTQYLRQKSNE